MKFFYSQKFKELYKELPSSIQNKFSKQIKLMENNFRHPSLHTKKIQGSRNIWEGRVDYQYRFTFSLENETVILRVIGPHDEALKNP